MGRGLGVNKPCIKCGREVPYSFKSPIPGFCGRCTDEVLRTLNKAATGPGAITANDGMALGASGGQKAGWAVLGGVIAAVGLIVFAALVPGAFDAVRDGLRALLGLR